MASDSTQGARNAYARAKLQRALARQMQSRALPDAATQTPQFLTGTYTATMTSVDANLSQVLVGSTTYSYVPTLGTVSGNGYAPGNVVLLVKIGTSLILLGKLSGNTTLAPHTNTAHS